MLDERNTKILCAVVQCYIVNPEPVGSRYITKKYPFNLSPATIRNIMADLEEMGFLNQPHTSAGRVPTDKGYRFYVDSLGDSDNRYKDLIYEITDKLKSVKNDTDILFNEVVKTVSIFSHYLGVLLLPNPVRTILSRVELLKYRGNQIAVVLFTKEGMIKNKVLNMGAELTQKDLNRISEYLNTEFYGYTIEEIRSRIIKEIAKEKLLCDTLITKAINICKEALYFSDSDIFVSGFSEVLRLPDFSDIQRIKEISTAIEDKHLIIKMLKKLSDSDSVQVVIGTENQTAEMRGLSMVAASYKEGEQKLGTIGIIGPTRMDYAKAITIVDTTAKFITRVFTEKK